MSIACNFLFFNWRSLIVVFDHKVLQKTSVVLKVNVTLVMTIVFSYLKIVVHSQDVIEKPYVNMLG